MKTTITTSGLGYACEKIWNEAAKAKIEKIISAYITAERPLPDAASECELSLTFAESRQMAEINREYREIDSPTDVLSFAMWESAEGAFEPPEDWEILPLGDIVVCLDEVEKNARENGQSTESELALVIFHGFLHLIGFDHAEEEEKAAMWERQERMVKEFLELHDA